jgi:hypothetical protein
VPLGAANPFGGEDDYTISTKFTSSGSSFDPALGLVLFSSADADEPTEGDNQSMSIYINSQADGGGLVVDYFFNSEVVVPGAGLLDGLEHSIIVAYVAPDDPGDPNDPNPGSLYINIDGDWIGTGDIAPRPPTITNHVVRIGTSLNTDFPFINSDDPDNPIQVNTDFEGTVDDFRILNEAVAPTLLRATVDVMSGEVTLLTGELHRELRYYEIVSADGSLNPAAWASLSDQNLDPSGVGIGDTWDEFAGSAEQLAEGRLNGGSLFSPSSNTSVSLGNVFTPFGAQDLEINAVTTDNEAIAVEIIYSLPPSLPADFDNDGNVDGDDLAQWRGDFGENGLSDADGDNDSDGADFLIWQRTLGSTPLATTASGSAANGVPEPNCIALFAVALLFAPKGKFRRRTYKC